jgi:hypothetical protein
MKATTRQAMVVSPTGAIHQIAPVSFVDSAYSRNSSNGLGRALATAQNETDSDLQSQLESNLTDGLLAQGVDAALAQLNAQPSSALLVDLETRYIRDLAATDPRLAARTALLLNGPGRQQALEGALIVWANQKLDDAISWADDLPAGPMKDSVERSVACEAARTDPLTALNLVASQAASVERDQVLTYAIAQWAAGDPKSAAAWASKMEISPLRDQMVKSIAIAWAETDPVSAAALALRSLPEGRDQDDAVTGIVQRMTEADPQAAANWVTQFPEGQLRDSAEENMVKLWTDQNPQDVAAWLGTLPPTMSRDVAIRAYAEQMSPFDRSLATQWTQSISNAEMRNAEIKSLASVK